MSVDIYVLTIGSNGLSVRNKEGMHVFSYSNKDVASFFRFMLDKFNLRWGLNKSIVINSIQEVKDSEKPTS